MLFNHHVPEMTFDQLCVECLFKAGGGDIENILLLSEEKKRSLTHECGWPLSRSLQTHHPSWKPELQPVLWNGQVCDPSGVLARVFFSGLVNKGDIFGTRPSVALTKEEPNAQRLSFIARVFLFFIFSSEKMRGEQDRRPGNLGFSRIRCVCWRYCNLCNCILY